MVEGPPRNLKRGECHAGRLQFQAGTPYEHIKKSAQERGESESRAKEIASRTVNKERARSGEAKSASRQSLEDMSSSRRGGLRSGHGSGGPTKDQLYAAAQQRGVKGRSSMSKPELEKALGK